MARVAVFSGPSLKRDLSAATGPLPSPAGFTDFIGKQVDITGLGQVIKGPLGQGLLGGIPVPVAREHDHGKPRGLLMDFGQHLVAVHAGHADIQDDHIRGMFQAGKGCLPVFRQDGIKTFAL